MDTDLPLLDELLFEPLEVNTVIIIFNRFSKGDGIGEISNTLTRMDIGFPICTAYIVMLFNANYIIPGRRMR